MDIDAIIIEGSCEPAEVIDLSKDQYCVKCGALITKASHISITDLLRTNDQLCPICSNKNVGGEQK